MGKNWYRSCPLAAAQGVTKRNGGPRATTSGTIPKQLTRQSPKDAGGSELFRRSMGREYAIATDVLSRDWDYVALGHWHKRGPVPLVSTGAAKNCDTGRVWYAGSSENMGFGDLRDHRNQAEQHKRREGGRQGAPGSCAMVIPDRCGLIYIWITDQHLAMVPAPSMRWARWTFVNIPRTMVAGVEKVPRLRFAKRVGIRFTDGSVARFFVSYLGLVDALKQHIGEA